MKRSNANAQAADLPTFALAKSASEISNSASPFSICGDAGSPEGRAGSEGRAASESGAGAEGSARRDSHDAGWNTAMTGMHLSIVTCLMYLHGSASSVSQHMANAAVYC